MTTLRQKTAFVPGLSYVAAREFLLGGMTLVPGDPVDRSMASDRLLRQLRDQGRIRLAPGGDSRRVVARRPLVLGGETYRPGDSIPRDAFQSERRLQQMVAGKFVELVRGTVRRRVTSRRAAA